MKGVVVERLSDTVLYLYRGAIDMTQDMISSLQPSARELYVFLRSLLITSTYESAWHNVKIGVDEVCNQIIMGSLQRIMKSSRTWNSSHLYAGSIGLFIGGGVTILCTNYMFPITRYLTLTRAVVVKHDRGLQGVGYIEEAPVSVIIGPNDVLIHVKAASLDTIDLDVIYSHGTIVRSLFQNSMLQKRQKFPLILGRDCTGIVVDIGNNVTKFEISDEVWLAVPYWLTGTLTEFISLNESYISHKPERLDFVDAASLPYSTCVALDCVKRRAGIDRLSGKNKKVLIHGGNTAVGCIIVQLCALYNVNITASCISQAVNKMLDAGAQSILLLDHSNPDLSRKYDIVFNTMGESAYQFCRQHLADNGSIIDASGGYYVPLRNYDSFTSYLYIIWLKFLRIFGLRPWKDVPINSDIINDIADLVNEGKLYPVTDSVFNVKSCDRAFWFLQHGKVVGKPVICFR